MRSLLVFATLLAFSVCAQETREENLRQRHAALDANFQVLMDWARTEHQSEQVAIAGFMRIARFQGQVIGGTVSADDTGQPLRDFDTEIKSRVPEEDEIKPTAAQFESLNALKRRMLRTGVSAYRAAIKSMDDELRDIERERERNR